MAEPNLFNFEDFLETQPQALYQSFLQDPATRMTPSMRKYYRNQFNQIQGEYIGELARQMRQGNVPTMRFQDYLQSDVFTQAKPPSAEQLTQDPASSFYGGPKTQYPSQPYDLSSPMYSLTGYDRFRKESPFTRSGYGAGPMGQRIFAPSARWITY
tara:strand:- start:130 stop:597 length:468 start_codon:yes stop_codon:yes gene_type:complete